MIRACGGVRLQSRHRVRDRARSEREPDPPSTPAVLLAPETRRSRSRTATLRLHSASPGTSTGRARDRYTICGYDTHAGAGIATTSPGPNSVKHALNNDCFEPLDTTMLSAFTGRPPESSDRCFAAAARSSRIPSFAG